jgi:putative heme-binding domain-containing protein
VPGVDLGHNKFRRATTDDDLIKIIRNGIPGTAMPANAMSEAAASAVVSYLHALAASANKNTSKGDAVHGKILFEGSAGCTGCHRIDGKGSHLGPDLSEIGRLRRSADLETSILDPDAEIAPSNRFVTIVTKDNATVTGRMMNHDSFTVQIMDPKERMRSFDMSDVKEFTFLEHSSMPSYRGKLSAQELADITSYLTTLKGSR